MFEIEAKRKLRASEGAHFFFTLIFFVISIVIELNYKHESCSVNLFYLIDFVFYGMIIWSVFLILTLIPKCKNKMFK